MEIINDHIEYGGGKQNPDTIVVHCMSEYLGDDTGYMHAVDFLKKYKLSAHVLVAPNGDIYRCRYDNEGAWHARGFNKDSLGIEFLVQGLHDYGEFVERIKTPYLTKHQYQSGVAVVRDWMSKHPIKTITRHSDLSPSRKVDPGKGFPWQLFLRDLE